MKYSTEKRRGKKLVDNDMQKIAMRQSLPVWK
jgi:ribosome-associated protein YbcJ (S4-like RNA binding protein)